MTDFERLVAATDGELWGAPQNNVRVVLRALDAIGYQAVPKVATEKMANAALPVALTPREAYTAMLAAAPKLGGENG